MVVGLILAAGKSTRMGRPKALLPIGDDTFVTRLVKTFRRAGLDDVIVVIRPDTGGVVDTLRQEDTAARLIVNETPDGGQLSSLLAGLDVADRPGVEAIVVGLVDVPLVRPETVQAIVDAWRRSGAPVVRPVAGGRHGHPVLFDRRTFGELRRADPQVGARQVVRARRAEAADLAVDDPGAFDDIDTPEDYARLIGSASDT